MKRFKQLLAITGSALIITACQEINNESDVLTSGHSAVDTVPKGKRGDTAHMGTVRDTMRRSDTTPMGRRGDTMYRRSDTTPTGRRGDTMYRRRGDTTPMGRRGDTTMAGNYIDLRTGQPVDLYYDAKARRTYSASTNEPVEFYVNTATGDTVYGRGRYIVNNYIIRTADGIYKLDEKRIRIDKDEIKIKDGNKKFKMEEGKIKIKEDKQKARSTRDTTMRRTDTMRNE